MSISYYQTDEVICGSCNKSFSPEVWLIVDIEERPDLYGQIIDGSLHVVICPHCNDQGWLDVPLLVLQKEKPPHLIFVPTDQANEVQNNEKANQLIDILQKKSGKGWQERWLKEGAPGLPWELVEIALEEGLEAAEVALLPPHVQTMLEHLSPENREKFLILSGQANTEEEFQQLLEKNPELMVALQNAYKQMQPSIREVLDLAFQARQTYRNTGDFQELKASIDAWEYILSNKDLEDYDIEFQATVRNHAGIAFFERYQAEGDVNDLEQAISLCRLAVKKTPKDSEYLPTRLNNFSLVLADRFDHFGNIDDLEEVIRCSRIAVDLTSDDSDDKPGFLTNLSGHLRRKYSLSGDVVCLEEAIKVAKEAVEISPPESPGKAGILNDFSNVLADRYALHGEINDLEEAIQAAYQSVELTPEGSVKMALRLNNLGNRLSERFARTGDIADMDEAIQKTQMAADLTPGGSSEKGMYLNNLGNRLAERYTRIGEVEDLEKALLANREAVELTADESPSKGMYLSNLSIRLAQRFKFYKAKEDLEESIKVARIALEFTQEGSPQFIRGLNTLGNRISERYEINKDSRYLDEAIEIAKRLAKLVPKDSPDKAFYLYNHGSNLLRRYDLGKDLVDLDQGRKLIVEAIELGRYTSPTAVIQASRSLGQWLLKRGDWDKAIDAFQPGMHAIEELVRKHALRASKESWLQEARGVPTQYAYALAQSGNLEEALIGIEIGQARLLSERISLNNLDLQLLQDKAPELFKQYENFSMLSNKWQTTDLNQDQDIEVVRDELRKINQQFSHLGLEIRKIEGFEHFLAPVQATDIYLASQNQPLAYLATTPVGGMVLLALPGKETEVLWFNDFTDTQLFQLMHSAQGNGYLDTYLVWKQAMQSGISRDDYQAAYQEWLDAIENTTRWLWQEVIGELVEWLIENHFKACTLTPTGLLSLLPLHAAWVKDGDRPTGKRYAMDEMQFSYVPNAQALLKAQKKAGISMDNILVVQNPNSDHPKHDIPFSMEMGEAALEYFTNGENIHLKEAEATIEAVLGKFPEANVLHFWTHGLSNPEFPLESCLLMADEEELKLRNILLVELPKARLAVLSACETGMAGLRNIDEVVSLPTGLIQAGVPGVIGSMWTVETISTLMLMLKFYELWKAGKGVPAQEAFRQSQQWLRDTTNQEKEVYYKNLREHESQQSSYLMPVSAARAASLELMLKNPEKRSYAHPFFWAAFGYYGV